jgi:hypothetical protein
MAQYRRDKQVYTGDGNTYFEVNMIAGANGIIYDTGNPLPVKLYEGHANVTVISNSASPVITRFADSIQLDTLSRLRTGQIQTQYWYAPSIDSDGDWRFSDKLNGTGSGVVFLANTSEIQMTSGNTATGYAYRQSRIKYKIIPGASHQAYFTVNWTSNSTTSNTVTKRVGLFDSNNGIFWENTDNTLAVVVRRALANGQVTEDRIYSNTFNTDKLDGTGASGFNIFTAGLDKYYTFWFDFTGGRTGRIRFGLGTTAGATIAHTQNYSGSIATNFIADNSLPTRREIFNLGAQTTTPYFSLSGSVFQYEEPRSYNPFLATAKQLTAIVPSTGALTPLMTIGLRPGWPYTRGDVTLQDFHIYDTANQSGKSNVYGATYYYELIFNANVNGTYAYAGNGATSNTTTGKASKYYTWANTAVVTGGSSLKNGIFYSAAGEALLQSIPETFNFGSDIDGNPDTVTLCVRTIVPGTEASQIISTASWLEQL